MGTMIPTAFAHLVSVTSSEFSQYFKLFQYFICYGDDQYLWFTIVIVLECHKPCSYRQNLTDKYCTCSHCSTKCSPPLLGPPYSLRYNNTEIRSINPTRAYNYVFKWMEEWPIFYFKSKARMIKLSEGMSKAKLGWKLGLPAKQLAKSWMQRKSSWRKLKVWLQCTHKY